MGLVLVCKMQIGCMARPVVGSARLIGWIGSNYPHYYPLEQSAVTHYFTKVHALHYHYGISIQKCRNEGGKGLES